jgi:hypothetical protein
MLFKSSTLQSDTAVHIGYIVSEILEKKMKTFSDREIIKECLNSVADVDKK